MLSGLADLFWPTRVQCMGHFPTHGRKAGWAIKKQIVAMVCLRENVPLLLLHKNLVLNHLNPSRTTRQLLPWVPEHQYTVPTSRDATPHASEGMRPGSLNKELGGMSGLAGDRKWCREIATPCPCQVPFRRSGDSSVVVWGSNA